MFLLFTFSLAISAVVSCVTPLLDDFGFAAVSTCSCNDAYMVCNVSSRNLSPPCLARRDKDTGHLSWTPTGSETCNENRKPVWERMICRVKLACVGGEKRGTLTWQQPDILAKLVRQDVWIRYSSDKISLAPSLGGISDVGITNTPSSC